jgi:uncharacterized C2H2 Zn-finger protein
MGDGDCNDRGCPACGHVMSPIELRSGEIAYRCPACHQISI